MFSVHSWATIVRDYVGAKCGFSELHCESGGGGGRGDDLAGI